MTRMIADPTARLADLVEICRTFRLEALGPQLQACRELTAAHGIVDVAVLGQFKAGKSSFLNSLVGAEVLPTGVLPVTALVTRLAHGEADGLQVQFRSGERRSAPLADLTGYVAERDNPENAKGVVTVDVTLAALAPFRGLRFVDTPGLGSVFAHNTRASLDWLPRVGGALVAIAAHQPLSEQDLALLREVSRHTPEVTILLTKADLVSPEDLGSVQAFIHQQTLRHLDRPPKILPYSTRPGFEALREAVHRHLLEQVAGEHESLAAEILDHKLHALAQACGDYLRLARTAAAADAAARSALLDLLRAERAHLPALRGEVATLARDLQTRLRTRASEHFHAFRGEVARRLRAGLEPEMRDWRGNLARQRARFEAWLVRSLAEEMGRMSERGNDLVGPFLAEAQASVHRTVRAFQDRLAQATERALCLRFEGAAFQAVAQPPRHPDIHVGQVFDTQVDLLWFLIPMGIFGPLFRRHCRKLLPWEAEKHLARLAHQWSEATQAAVAALVAEAVGFMGQELATLEGLVATAQDQGPALEDALARLDPLPGEAVDVRTANQ